MKVLKRHLIFSILILLIVAMRPGLGAERNIEWLDGSSSLRLVTFQDNANLGTPDFDPYANSGTPNPPNFGSESIGDPPGNPGYANPYTLPKDPPNSSTRLSDLLRFAETPRLQFSWLPDGNGLRDLSQQEFDLSVVFAFPNFLNTEQPIYVAPSFGMTMLQGGGIVGLPNQVYSGVLDMQWRTDPRERFSVDLGVGVGVHTDFRTFNVDSLRLTGHALFNVGLNEETTFRGGVVYYDRLALKMLPAFGLLWHPNPEARIDLFFPRPRVSQFLTSLTNYDVWWYYGAEYGGGSWTMRQSGGTRTQTDINDIRVTTGFEFGLPAQLKEGEHIGFIEVGLVFEREVVFRSTPGSNFDPGTTVMIKAGIGY